VTIMSELWVNHLSYSQMTTAEECPYAYFLLKAAKINPVPNGFAEAGNLAHELLAGWAKGNIAIGELPVLWSEQFPLKVTAGFPGFLASKGYEEKLFQSILSYFENFTGFPGYEILDAEKEFVSMIADERFVGVADLILRDKATGRLVIVDYKSASLSTFKRNKRQMYRQLYLYAKHCADLYGAFPEKLRFELIKEGTYDEQCFDQETYIAARIWAESVIQDMKGRDLNDWLEVRPEFFRCTALCSCRDECCYGKKEAHMRNVFSA